MGQGPVPRPPHIWWALAAKLSRGSPPKKKREVTPDRSGNVRKMIESQYELKLYYNVVGFIFKSSFPFNPL